MFNLLNFAAYQLAWFAVVIGAAREMAWAGALVALLVVIVHLAFRREAVEFRLIGAALLLGLLVDGALALSGQVRFADAWPQNLAPYWMSSLWIAFATTLNHSLRWLMRRPAVAAAGGAIGGPLAYLAGAKLGALSFVSAATALPLIGILWALAMCALSLVVVRAATLPARGRLPA